MDLPPKLEEMEQVRSAAPSQIDPVVILTSPKERRFGSNKISPTGVVEAVDEEITKSPGDKTVADLEKINDSQISSKNFNISMIKYNLEDLNSAKLHDSSGIDDYKTFQTHL
mmetsp:Transcript_11507/g.17326  ORF Transcript_11507/g.17326 Transcript_11507/m.17326 type:complete len:112 (+) Transcript_11507:1206-1541(+)